MNRHFRFLWLLGLVFIYTSSAFSQRLPQGEYHANRERQYDILHYKAEISFDFQNKTIFAKSTITLTPLHALSGLAFDAIHLNVKKVYAAKDKVPFRYQTKGAKLNIQLAQKIDVNDTLRLVIEYEARPKGGMYFRRDPQNSRLYFVTTYGEFGLHANWLPIYNDVNDKFSSEMLIKVPPPYVAISNGKLIDTQKQPDGQTIYHWSQKLPHSNYLMALYVGDFEKGNLRPAFGSIPMGYWVPRGKLKQGAYVFRNTPKMVEFFSNRFNYRFPWDKYDQVAVPDYAIGAMEHTGITGHRANILRNKNAPLEFNPTIDAYTADWNVESIISHELGHHWFGDNLTCRNLSFIWLNESFASYLMMLWDEKSLGKDQLLFDLELAKQHYFDYVKSDHIIRPLEYHYFDDANEIYNEQHTYLKGAAILHMLRKILGDESYFRALSYYLHKHQFANVESHDLKIAIEEATGRNLDWFFADWVTGAGHPIFDVSYRYLRDKKLIDLTVKQVQPIVEGQDLFKLPVRISLATAAKRWEKKIWIEKESENFLIRSDEKPLMVSFDGEGDLVAEIHFSKKIDELLYQARQDAVPGKIWAIRQLAKKFPSDHRTLAVFNDIFQKERFWGVKAEAAFQLGQIRTAGAEKLIAKALQAKDYRIRKAAVLTLPKFGSPFAAQKLRDVIQKDASGDVVAAAILALAKADAKLNMNFFKSQLSRKSWNNEIIMGVLRAMGELRRAEFVPTIKKYATDAYNQYVRSAALSAWEACAPADKTLHQTLITLTQSPVYTLQQEAIVALGRLYVPQAVDALNTIIDQNADRNLVVAARQALKEIERVQKEGK